MNLIVIGTIGFDSVETPQGKADMQLGGTAVFCCIAASFFTRVGMVAAIGQDFPDHYLEQLRSRDIDLAGLETLSGDTFHWGARYHHDMNSRDTLFTHLNVVENFSADVPASYRDVEYVFLGNIDPDLQLHVISQVAAPKFIGMDTMNYWIDGTKTRRALEDVLKKTGGLFINDEEARQLSGEHNLVKAAKAVTRMGPEYVIIKKGEHGALLFTEDRIFAAPAFPLEHVNDPTGAGDAFAGGFMGFLATGSRLDEGTLRQAMIYGSTLASFVVEDFSVSRLDNLSLDHVNDRYRAYHNLMHFEVE